ncbi:MAG TPA: HypC/HybG/HupF family hydrogenase formation chaperone [Candidatus Binatia bacterium]|jgi:hydrogenase expression/formation protein HypC
MCLGIPGEVQSITEEGALRMGRVAFGGIVKQVCLAYVPEAETGDFVIVHAGFAISRIDGEAAARVFAYLDEIGVTQEEDAMAPTTKGPRAR